MGGWVAVHLLDASSAKNTGARPKNRHSAKNTCGNPIILSTPVNGRVGIKEGDRVDISRMPTRSHRPT
jgi:hypothetical protein